jgi:hypothetical protein
MGLLAVAIVALAAVLFGGGGRGAGRSGARGTGSGAGPGPRWVTGWATALARASGSLGARGLGRQTLRLVVPSSSGGDEVRIEASNRFGQRPVEIGAATVALTTRSGRLHQLRQLTFDHRAGIRLTPGSQALSDPVTLPVPSTGAALTVSLWLPGGTGPLTAHPGGAVPAHVATGDHASDVDGRAFRQRLAAVPLLSSVQLRTRTSAGTLVVIGGSIVGGGRHGLASGLVSAQARLAPERRLAVVDEGLTGNQVLAGTAGGVGSTGPSLLSRFGADALALPGTRAVLILAGAEDIAAAGRGAGPSTALRLEQAYTSMIRAAHHRGLAVYLGTMPPPAGARPGVPGTDPGQLVRERVNGWMRTTGAARGPAGADAVLDFDAVLRDPRDWRRLQPSYASRDNAIPNDAGYAAMVRYAGPGALTGAGERGLSTPPRAVTSALPAGATAMLDLSGEGRGSTFARGAVGLSVEASVLSGPTLDPARGNLARVMRLLGPGVLRVAGDAADLSFWTATGERAPRWAQATIVPADLRRLGALARATGWRVVLGVNLGHFAPARAASEAATAAHVLGASLAGIEIGNEPDRYPLQRLRPARGYGYGAYASSLAAYRTAIAAAAPGVRTVGPDLSSTGWTLRYARTQGRQDAQITQHYYPLWACQGSRPSIADLLGPRVRSKEDALLALLGRASTDAGRPAVLSETNSVACNGSATVSPRFASALWALDWALRSARRGVRNVEFHDQLGACTARTYSPLCLASASEAAAGQFTAQPVLYGLLAAARLEGGSFIPLALQAPSSVVAYATREPSGVIHLAVDNLSLGGTSQPVIALLPGRYRPTLERLVAPGLTARRGAHFGGAEIGPGGSWHAGGEALADGAGSLSLRLARGSAAIVTLTPVR